MYLSEKARAYLRLILMLWDELGHSPSFKEFDDDPRTPRANDLAYEFGSYSNAVSVAASYRNHPKDLAPTKDSSSGLPQKASSTIERTRAKVLSRQKKPSATPKSNPATAPKTPAKPTQKPPEPPKTPVPQKAPLAPPKPALNADCPLLINYLGQNLILISSDHYLAHSYNEPTNQFPYVFVKQSDCIAETKSLSHQTGTYRAITSKITFEVPILSEKNRPILRRHGSPPRTPVRRQWQNGGAYR